MFQSFFTFIRYSFCISLLLTLFSLGDALFMSKMAHAEKIETPEEAAKAAAKEQAVLKNPISFQLKDGQYRLYFSSSVQAGLAVFKKDKSWWFVFDKKIDFSVPEADLSVTLVTKIEKLNVTSSDPELTIVQLELKKNVVFDVQKDEKGWFISFSFFDNTVLSIPPIKNQKPLSLNEATWSSAVVSAIESSKEIYLTHEGQRFYILPSVRLDDGLRIAHQTPYFKLSYSVQGFVCQILSNRLFLERQKNQLLLKAADIFSFSTQAINPPNNYQEFLFFNSGSTRDWVSYKKDLEKRIRESTQANVPEMQLERAWVEVALGQGQEAMGVLINLKQQYPGIEFNPYFKAIEGMALFLSQNYAQAFEAWSFLSETTEIQFWKTISRELLANTVEINSFIMVSKSILDFYPPVLRNILTEIVLKVAAAAGEIPVIEAFTSSNYASEDKRLRFIFDFHKARVLQVGGSKSAAMALYKILLEKEQGSLVPVSIKVEAEFEVVLDQFSANTLKVDDVIKKLEALRLNWKGDQFEFRITKKLIEFLEEKQSFSEMLGYIRTLKKTFPERSMIEKLDSKMQTLFIAYFKQDLSKKSPLRAIAVYEEFFDLVPGGPSGDELMNIIADLFIEVDLLDQAAHVLAKWAVQKKDSPEKNTLILRVAEIHLLDKKPETVVTILQDLPKNNANDRDFEEKRLLLIAQAQASMGKTDEALVVLKDSVLPSHLKLASTLHMKASQWDEAAHKLSVLAGILDDTKDAELKKTSVLSLAICYYFNKQSDQILVLRKMYQKLMKDNKFFQYLTRPEVIEVDPRKIADKKLEEEKMLNDAIAEVLGPAPKATK